MHPVNDSLGKKIVRYVGAPTDVVIGFGTVLTPVNHPDKERVSNNKPVITSEVVSYNEATGRIETLNTIYIPE